MEKKEEEYYLASPVVQWHLLSWPGRGLSLGRDTPVPRLGAEPAADDVLGALQGGTCQSCHCYACRWGY